MHRWPGGRAGLAGLGRRAPLSWRPTRRPGPVTPQEVVACPMGGRPARRASATQERGASSSRSSGRVLDVVPRQPVEIVAVVRGLLAATVDSTQTRIGEVHSARATRIRDPGSVERSSRPADSTKVRRARHRRVATPWPACGRSLAERSSVVASWPLVGRPPWSPAKAAEAGAAPRSRIGPPACTRQVNRGLRRSRYSSTATAASQASNSWRSSAGGSRPSLARASRGAREAMPSALPPAVGPVAVTDRPLRRPLGTPPQSPNARRWQREAIDRRTSQTGRSHRSVLAGSRRRGHSEPVRC